MGIDCPMIEYMEEVSERELPQGKLRDALMYYCQCFHMWQYRAPLFQDLILATKEGIRIDSKTFTPGLGARVGAWKNTICSVLGHCLPTGAYEDEEHSEALMSMIRQQKPWLVTMAQGSGLIEVETIQRYFDGSQLPQYYLDESMAFP